MFITSPTTHVYRGKGEPHHCERCGWLIKLGQAYERYVWQGEQYGPVFVEIRHADELDCPLDDEELIHELWQESFAETSVAITMKVSERLVMKTGINGEPIIESEPFIEMTAEGSEEPEAPKWTRSGDTDDEIPF